MDQEQRQDSTRKKDRKSRAAEVAAQLRRRKETLEEGATFWSVLRDFFRHPKETWRLSLIHI